VRLARSTRINPLVDASNVPSDELIQYIPLPDTTTMQALANALLGELASRTISFLVSTYGSTAAAAAAPEQEEEDLRHRLRLLLLRCGTIVEEAEGRRVTSRGMLQQLGALRDEMLRGYYVLDTIRYDDDDDDDQQAPPPAAAGGGAPSAEDGRHRRRAFAPSRFNPAKRVRFRRFASGGDPEATAAVVHRRRVISLSELQRTVRCLEAAAMDTKELVVFLVRCPRLHRQPYSAHLFLDKYMFGRNAERDHVVGFLLRTDPPGAANLGVLPIVGPRFIGKSTLVEHVCGDERVRDHFSSILLYRADDLEEETLSSFRKNCVTKQHRKSGASDGRSLIVIELAGDVDDNTWKRLYSSAGRRLPQGSKILLTSRSERRSRGLGRGRRRRRSG
jgi:PAS domain-containing protein